MSEKEYKEKAKNCFLQNTVLINENEQLKKKNKILKECIDMQMKEVQELYESYERRLKPLQKENEELKAVISKTETTTEKNLEVEELVEELKAQIEQAKKQYKKQRNRRLDELQKENAELKNGTILKELTEKVKQQAEQIEKMKCCDNCKHCHRQYEDIFCDFKNEYDDVICNRGYYGDFDGWELAE